MLFTPTGTRTFNAVQSNGETRPIEYTIDDEGNAIIIAVDHIKVSDAPLPPQFAFIVQGWIAAEQLQVLAQPLTKNGYGQYLLRILKENVF